MVIRAVYQSGTTTSRIVGGGTRALPDHVRLDLEFVDERRFGNGMVYVHHRLAGTG